MRVRIIPIVGMALLMLGISNAGFAGIDINVGVSIPPLVISREPEVVVIPGTDVYFCPDIGTDVFFHGGFWFRPYGNRWYRSASYNGPWGFTRDVPDVFLRLPPNFRSMTFYRRVPYRELNRNWRAWGRDKYWDRFAHERRPLEREREHGLAPRFGEERGRGGDRGHVDGRSREMGRHDTGSHHDVGGHGGAAGGHHDAGGHGERGR
jgi:hypothetical protein